MLYQYSLLERACEDCCLRIVVRSHHRLLGKGKGLSRAGWRWRDEGSRRTMKDGHRRSQWVQRSSGIGLCRRGFQALIGLAMTWNRRGAPDRVHETSGIGLCRRGYQELMRLAMPWNRRGSPDRVLEIWNQGSRSSG